MTEQTPLIKPKTHKQRINAIKVFERSVDKLFSMCVEGGGGTLVVVTLVVVLVGGGGGESKLLESEDKCQCHNNSNIL